MASPFFPYRTRRAAFDRHHRFDDWTVKVYTIDAGAGGAAAASVDAALARLPGLLPEIAGDVHGEAFTIVHAGEDAVWHLVHWWADHCLLHHRVEAAALGAPTDFTISVPETLIACTWELAVVQWERDAWVRSVQGRGADADVDAYRADVMPPTLV